MRQKVWMGIVVAFVVMLGSPLFTQDVKKKENSHIYIRGNPAKLYEILKLIDDRNNWLHVSELLREILASDIDDPFIRNQLDLAKREIDTELVEGFFREKVLDWPFVVAKLRIVEAMMANHPMLNISYDREVVLIKGLMKSYFFPGHEEDGEIIFPNPSTYKFDLYGYVKDNILKTETASSGEIDDPRFPTDSKKIKKDDSHSEGPVQIGAKQPRVANSTGRLEAEPKDFEQDIKAIQETLEKTRGLFSATFKDIEDLVKVSRKINQYEPWSLLLLSIANPDAAEYDPQLRDFLSGVKLRMKVGTYHYDPQSQQILKESMAVESDVGLTLEEDINWKTGQVTLYALANLSSPEVFSLRLLIYFRKFVEFMDNEQVSRVASAAVQISQVLEKISKIEIPQGKHWAVVGGFGVAKGVGKLGSFLLGAEGIVVRLAKWERFHRWLDRVQKNRFIKERRYFKIAISLTMATDLAEGVVRILGAPDAYGIVDAVETTVSKEAATLLYVLPLVSQKAIWRYLGWGAFTLDVGHFVSPKIPRTSQIIKSIVFDYTVDQAMDWTIGETFKDMMIKSYEKKLGIVADEAQSALNSLKHSIENGSEPAQLIVADEVFAQLMKDYANKRLFLIYYLMHRWDNREIEERGEMERRYWKSHQSYAVDLSKLRMAYNKRLEDLSKKENDKQAEKENLLKQLRERRKE